MTGDPLAQALALQVRAVGIPEPELEYRFSARKWKFDLCWPDAKLAVEINGGVWTIGRHQRPGGYLKEHGPSRGRAVADALGVNHQMINKVMNRTPGIEKVGEEYDSRNGQNVAIWGWKG